MTLEEGRRVRLAEDLGIGEAVAGEPGAVVGFLSLGAGIEGTVERVDGELPAVDTRPTRTRRNLRHTRQRP